jgi:dipeptidase
MFNKDNLRKTIVLTVIFAAFILLFSIPAKGCFSIIVGKDASADGFVLVAHNEDDSPPQIVNHHKMPRKERPTGQGLTAYEYSWAYIWSEMPGVDYSDSFLNEWGVVVTSNNCPSKEDKPQISDGGIGKMLRRLIAQQAKTAREAVILAGNLVEQFGYLDSGRTYIIADPNEGWLFCAVNGKHWLAQRVPDDQVAMVANTYTIRDVNLSDKQNFLACDDIVEYAAKRDWYKQSDGKFDFALSYANPKDANSPVNYGRQWAGLSHICKDKIQIGPNLPFSVKPKEKIDVPKLMEILRFDNIQAKPELMQQCSEEEKGSCIICRGNTQTAFVAQLRNDVPRDIGIVYWLCLSQPGGSCFIPFHFGIDDFPAGYKGQSQRPTEEFFNSKLKCDFKADAAEAFWTFANFSNKVYGPYSQKSGKAKDAFREIEKEALSLQELVEKTALKYYEKDRSASMQLLANYSKGLFLSALEEMDSALKD